MKMQGVEEIIGRGCEVKKLSIKPTKLSAGNVGSYNYFASRVQGPIFKTFCRPLK
jgi:hypothetical protein